MVSEIIINLIWFDREPYAMASMPCHVFTNLGLIWYRLKNILYFLNILVSILIREMSKKNQKHRENQKKIIEKIKPWKKPIKPIKILKKPNWNESKLKKTRKKPRQTEKTKSNRFEPVFIIKNQTKPKPVNLNQIRFFYKNQIENNNSYLIR